MESEFVKRQPEQQQQDEQQFCALPQAMWPLGGGFFVVLTLEAVITAYMAARRRKRHSAEQLAFEQNLENNLVRLYHDLATREYSLSPHSAFIVTHPTPREVWAASFRDRVVHHVLYNAVAERFTKRFIRDCYACLPQRGTHDGLRRMQAFARSVTLNWQQQAYFLKIDIAAFFNTIGHRILWERMEPFLPEPWLQYYWHQAIHHNPRPTVRWLSPPSLRRRVPAHKSYAAAPIGKGLPIGNLTSQLCANIYLNPLDQWVKHTLGIRYYGRYMDDMVLLHADKAVLIAAHQAISDFLQADLALTLHPRKTQLQPLEHGLDFVGYIIKPYRTYIRQRTARRAKQAIIKAESAKASYAAFTSYNGLLHHADAYHLAQRLYALHHGKHHGEGYGVKGEGLRV